MITLEIVGPHGAEGTEDENGTEYFNDRIKTPYGDLGMVKTREIDGESVITRADQVVLFTRDRDGWSERQKRETTVRTNAFGVTYVLVRASNGWLEYQLVEDELMWSDEEKTSPKIQIGVLVKHDWSPVVEPDATTESYVVTKYLGVQ